MILNTCNPIPALGRLRQDDLESKASLGYIVRSYLKKNPKNQTKTKTPHNPKKPNRRAKMQ
jgi:hypothetical protein